MVKRLKIGVIFGGRSGEHEVSLVSARSVMRELNKTKYQIVPIKITKQGEWVVEKSKSKNQKSKLPPKELLDVDVVFPVLHGTYGEDGTIQGMLEMLSIPYVGAGVLGSAVGMDKVIQKQLYQHAGLPLVKYLWFSINENWKLKIKNLKLRYPLFVKPANMGSSVGVTKVKRKGELLRAIKEAGRYDRKVLIEEGVENAREIEVSILGNDNPKASLPGEVISAREFYDYEAKYIDPRSKTVVPAKLPLGLTKKIQEIALAAFKAVDCRGMARVDFLLNRKTGKLFINEINTIPGFTLISMYPKLWQASGISYPKLLDRLISLALENARQKTKLRLSYTPSKPWHQ